MGGNETAAASPTDSESPPKRTPEGTASSSTPRGSFDVKNPSFAAVGDAWRITERHGAGSKLTVARGGASKGNHVFTDLPASLRRGSTYQLRIDWTPHTSAPSINLHLRNPATQRFRVVGSVDIPEGTMRARTDTVVFTVPEDGLSQFMLGAVHFTGRRAGALVRSIEFEELDADRGQAPQRTSAAGRPKGFAAQARALAMKDAERQTSSFAHSRKAEAISAARARMIFHAHAVEKGLSRSNVRPGFGRVAIPGLARAMNGWLTAGHDKDDSFLQSSAAVMKAYFDRHLEMNEDVSHYRELFSDASFSLIDGATHDEGGVLPAHMIREVVADDDTDTDHRFLDVMYGRRSVREFTQTPVADAEIERAVQIAMQAPSVCNRQGARVHQFEDPQLIKAVLEIQGGFNGYASPPRLLLVTADLDAFLFASERNQPFVDGGLFMMSLLLGLTEVGLGSCPLNTAMGTQKETAIRKLVDIPPHEVFISFVAVGHYDEKVLVPRSKRTGIGDVLKRHGSDRKHD